MIIPLYIFEYYNYLNTLIYFFLLEYRTFIKIFTAMKKKKTKSHSNNNLKLIIHKIEIYFA